MKKKWLIIGVIILVLLIASFWIEIPQEGTSFLKHFLRAIF